MVAVANNSYYVLFIDAMGAVLANLSDAQAGRLIKAIQANEEARQRGEDYDPGFTGALQMSYCLIKASLNRRARSQGEKKP